MPPEKAARDFVNRTPIVGTGPFQCVEFKKGSFVRMVANPDYYRGAPHIGEIVFQTYQNPDTMTADLEAGTIDAAQGVPQAQFTKLSQTEGLQAVAYNYRNWDYLCMNCYEGAASKGAAVLRDERFRRALNWAIDRQKLADLAWGGRAEPGTTILPPGQWVDPDYHWQPPADAAYTYDPAEAGRQLDAAGYVDADGDGWRESGGRPILLRLWADDASVEHQSEARLHRRAAQGRGRPDAHRDRRHGRLRGHGLELRRRRVRARLRPLRLRLGRLLRPRPDAEHVHRRADRGLERGLLVDAEFDSLCAQQATTLDTTERQQQIWRMQEIMYTQTPEIVLTYPQYLQAYDTAHWTGWTRVLGGEGPAFFVSMPDSYLNLQPVATDAGARPLDALDRGRRRGGPGRRRDRRLAAVAPARAGGGGVGRRRALSARRGAGCAAGSRPGG